MIGPVAASASSDSSADMEVLGARTQAWLAQMEQAATNDAFPSAGPMSPLDRGEILEGEPPSAPLARIRENARAMWFASAKAEIQVALYGAEDVLTRVALDVVK